MAYVGKRLEKSSGVPVVQIKESRGLALHHDTVGPAGATAVVAPYQAMNVGDEVSFTWQGYYQGAPEPAYRETKVLKAEDLGSPLSFTVPYVEIIAIEGEYADVSYRIKYAEGAGASTDSDLQRFDIVEPTSPLLPPITIKGYTGGPINPGHYPQGLKLQVKPVYTGIQEDDWLLFYFTGSEKAKSVIKALRVDRSTVDSGFIECVVEPRWLTENSNDQVNVFYQFARQGVAQSAQSLNLDISKPLYLPPPIVEGATPESENKGYLAASTTGAYVSFPESAEVGSGKVEMHWQGHPNGGRYIALTPVGTDPKRYFIPPSAVAANMSNLEQARFRVFYRVFPPGDSTGEDSVAFNLRITPLPSTRYPFPTSPQIVDNKMSLFSVPISGADIEIYTSPSQDAWPFMAEGQLLTIEATGVDKNGNTALAVVRDALPVTAGEFKNKKVSAKLPKAFLNTLKLNEVFTLKARVSFDGGETYTPFRDSTPTLIA